MIEKERLKKLKIIVSDLDGTLLDNKALIGTETKKIIKQLKDLGVYFSFATGRLHSALTGFAEELDIRLPIISLDGCLIKSYPEGKILFESFVKEKYVKKALAYADKFLLNVALCHADAIYYTEINSVIPQIMDKFGARYEEVPSYDNYRAQTLEVVFASDYKDNIKYVRDRLGFPYSFGLNVSYFRSQSHKGIYYLEIRKKGSNKGKSLLKLLKHLRIKPEESAIIGDWYNDLSLFQTPALKITLANAVPELKKISDIVAKRSNDEEGAAEFLEMVLKAKKGG